MKNCIFCDIAAGRAPCHKIWEDECHLAILSIFPNTEGFAVVLPKKHYPSYAFQLNDETLKDLVLAAKHVALMLDRTFDDVGRTGLFLEGFGVDHVHAKLFPMHGTGGQKEWSPVKSNLKKYFHQYEGYMSSHDSERADDAQLALLAEKIRNANQ
jgi:diadenosine tetraphosphate (Ap4A) HIT family hydrolase